MKTITEMAEKYVEERRDLDVGRANAQFNCFNMIDAVKFGANYVLEQIESLMNDVSDEYPRFQQGTIIHGRLIRLLEQLKK